MTSYTFSASDIKVFYLHVILTSECCHIKILLLILDLESENTPPPCTKFEQDQANILANMQVSSLFYSMTHSQLKVAMATPEVNENYHCMQNDPHRCKIKLQKFHFDTLCYFGVIKESLLGGRQNLPPPQVR